MKHLQSNEPKIKIVLEKPREHDSQYADDVMGSVG